MTFDFLDLHHLSIEGLNSGQNNKKNSVVQYICIQSDLSFSILKIRWLSFTHILTVKK